MRLLLILLTICLSGKSWAQNVTFAEKNPADSGTSIYFDKDGMLYPDAKIKNESLQKCKGSLSLWYSENPSFTDSLLAVYRIKSEKVTVKSSHEEKTSAQTSMFYTSETLKSLNEQLIKQKSRYLDSLANGNGLEFYIHGFRKSYLDNNQDVTSVAEFGMLEKSLDSSRTRKNVVVWVYWDGMYDCCFSSDFKRNKELFELYETAGLNADKVSESFAKMLENSTSQYINIVAHSLGTKIAVQSVMNCEKDFHRFRVCLIEPAISSKLFKKFYEGSTQIPNRSWLISYNENDFVLKKKDNKIGVFGPGAYKYGETTLGCNKKKDAEKLQKWMKVNQSLVQFELVNKTYIGKCHSLRCYTKNENLTEVSTFLESK